MDNDKRIHSWLCLRPNVLKAPAHLSAAPRLITGSLCRCAVMCGSGNPLTPALSLPLSGKSVFATVGCQKEL